jgi:hypothetical protein
VLVEVIEADELGQPTEVELIVHSKSRDDTYETMRKTKATDVKAVVHDLPPESYFDGLLGLSFIRRFKLRPGLQEGVLEIE